MPVITFPNEETIRVPPDVVDFPSFIEWFRSRKLRAFQGKIEFILGDVWLDMSREHLLFHNVVKEVYNQVVGEFVKKEKLGKYFSNRVQIVNEAAELSCQPDGTYVSRDSLISGQAKLIKGNKGRLLELVGSPDMVMQVVTPGLAHKAHVILRDHYWRANIREYWLIDTCSIDRVFQIYRHSSKGYLPTRKQDGWIKSQVFGKSFRFDDRLYSEYLLAVQES